MLRQKPTNINSLKNLQYRQQKQSRGGVFMYNYNFDQLTSNKVLQILMPQPEQESDKITQPITSLDPTKSEEIADVGRDI